MEYFAGLDVAAEETSICVIDQEGKLVLETKVATDPDAIFKALKKHARSLRRVGHEAGSFSPWLQVELKNRGLAAVCLEDILSSVLDRREERAAAELRISPNCASEPPKRTPNSSGSTTPSRTTSPISPTRC